MFDQGIVIWGTVFQGAVHWELSARGMSSENSPSRRHLSEKCL